MELLSAIQLQPFERVKELVDSMENLSNSENIDYQALNLALELKRRRTASYLIEMNYRVNEEETSENENTPLHFAVVLGDQQIVCDLLTRKASIVAVNHEGDTPLHLAFLRRHNKITELILNFMFVHESYDYVNIKNTQGLTHMHIACTIDNEQLVQLFLNAGANLNDAVTKDSPYCSGYTAMHFAIENKCIEVSKLLLGADKRILFCEEDSNGSAPIRLACKNLKDFQILFYHLTYENEDIEGFYNFLTQFHIACLAGNVEGIHDFISYGAAINTSHNSDVMPCPGYTPLHCAVESNCIDTVEVLIANKAEVTRTNSYGMTPLHLALYNEDPKEKNTIVDLLYAVTEKKSNNLVDLNGLSYMHIAVTRNDIALVKVFLKQDKQNVNKKVLYNLRNFASFSPLHFAVRYGHVEMAGLLIKHGADVNCDDGLDKGTPLHLACKAGHKQLIDLLLDNGARADITRVSDKKSMIHLLVESYMDQSEGRAIVEANGNFLAHMYEKEVLLDCVKRLVNKKCDVNAISSEDGNTALHLACDHFWDGLPCIQKLLEFGADINVENYHGVTPLRSAVDDRYRDNASDYMMLYHHVQKLKAIGYHVNPENEICCQEILEKRDKWEIPEWSVDDSNCLSEEELEQKQQQRLDEITKMKNLMLDKTVSLYDFLHFETKLASAYVSKKPLVKLIKDAKELEEQFSSYAYLIKLCYCQAHPTPENILLKRLMKKRNRIFATKARRGTQRSRK